MLVITYERNVQWKDEDDQNREEPGDEDSDRSDGMLPTEIAATIEKEESDQTWKKYIKNKCKAGHRLSTGKEFWSEMGTIVSFLTRVTQSIDNSIAIYSHRSNSLISHLVTHLEERISIHRFDSTAKEEGFVLGFVFLSLSRLSTREMQQGRKDSTPFVRSARRLDRCRDQKTVSLAHVRSIYFRAKERRKSNEFDSKILGLAIERIPVIGSVIPGIVLLEFPWIDEWGVLLRVHVEKKSFLFTKITRRRFVDQWDGFQSVDSLLKFRISDLTLKEKFRIDRCPQSKRKCRERARIRTWTWKDQRLVTVISVHRFFSLPWRYVCSLLFRRYSLYVSPPRRENTSRRKLIYFYSRHFNDKHDETSLVVLRTFFHVITRLGIVNHPNNKQEGYSIVAVFFSVSHSWKREKRTNQHLSRSTSNEFC